MSKFAFSVWLASAGSVTDEYELGEKLGEGHFGSTFVCTHRSTGKRYAVKKISKTRLLMLGTPLEEVKREVRLIRDGQVYGNAMI